MSEKDWMPNRVARSRRDEVSAPKLLALLALSCGQLNYPSLSVFLPWSLYDPEMAANTGPFPGIERSLALD
jgi:hypothetical protein